VSRGFKIAIGIPLTLLALLLLAGWPFHALFLLAVGWVSYLARSLPKVTIDPAGVFLLALCVVLAGGLGHGLCRWLWKGTGHEAPWRPRWTIAGLATILLMFAAGMAVTGVAHQTGWLLRSPEPLLSSTGRSSNTRNAAATLATLRWAQHDFSSNDRDANGKNDYWRGDIAGLYALKVGDQPIKLIEISLAGADARPLTDVSSFIRPAPKSGYWYRMLRFAGETTPDPGHWAAIAYPDSLSSGRTLFILSDAGTMYKKAWEGEPPPEVYPADPEKDGWSKWD
jgi:hypothetical protein